MALLQAGLVTFLGDFYAFASEISVFVHTAVLSFINPFDVSLIAVERAHAPTTVALIAQNGTAGPNAGATPPPQSLFSPWTMFFAASLFLFYALVLAPEKRRKAEREHQIGKLKKNDRVVTSGGIHGTIVTAAPDEDVVTIKVDSNTRLKINRSAISIVIQDELATGDEPTAEKT